VNSLDGLVLQGGADIAPESYGETPINPQWSGDRIRDKYEIELFNEFVRQGKPVFGICRGCQVINVAFGGTLIEHLPDVVGEEIGHRGNGPGTSSLHEVEIARGSKLLAIVGRPRPSTASSHHQAIRELAAGFEVSAHAPDGTIEGVERRDHPFYLAVQWHPEETAAEDPGQQHLFDALAAAALNYRKDRR
jgi:putative glutamine amidotransferase